MKYFLLVAGKGSRLHPITMNYPKSLFMLDDSTAVIERIISQISRFDPSAEIFVIAGFMHKILEKKIPSNVNVLYNPFFAVTNSLGSLWFAQDYLYGDCVFINGDIVMEDKILQNYVCKRHERPTILLDSSIKKDGDYNVQIFNDLVVVMSKGLDEYEGEYAGVVMLPEKMISQYRAELLEMIDQGCYEQWYEDALVNMIFKHNLKLYYDDINGMNWTEIDCVSDLVVARNIHERENKTFC